VAGGGDMKKRKDFAEQNLQAAAIILADPE
jgi:hypothetical protein